MFLKFRKFHRKTPVLESPKHRCFPMNFAKLLRASVFTEHLRWLNVIFILLQRPVFIICIFWVFAIPFLICHDFEIIFKGTCIRSVFRALSTSRMECFAKIVKSLTIFAKHFILTGSECASGDIIVHLSCFLFSKPCNPSYERYVQKQPFADVLLNGCS